MIRDSRTMYGASLHQTPEDVRAHWASVVEPRVILGVEIPFAGFPERGLEKDWEAHLDTHVVAYVNEGRWVADCPGCNSGIAVWQEMEDGACYDCGRVYSVDFPPTKECQSGEAVLLKRGDPHEMNWRPWEQDVGDLKAENARRAVEFVV